MAWGRPEKVWVEGLNEAQAGRVEAVREYDEPWVERKVWGRMVQVQV